MLEILSYSYMHKAFIGGILTAILCSLIGTFLVLRRFSFLSDGLAHVAFGGVAVGLFLGVNPLLSALVITAASSLWLQNTMKKAKLYTDAATALILSFGMALAIVIIGMVKGFTVNLFSYLFGSILTMSSLDLIVITGVFVITVAFVALMYRKLMFITFNEDLARVSGLRVDAINSAIAFLSALIVVSTMRAVGILLVSALIVIPTIIALQFARSFKGTLLWSALVSVISVITGLILSFYLDIPSGGTIVLFLCMLFVVVLAIKKLVASNNLIKI